MLYENKIKTYVSVEVLFDEAGQMLPRAVPWEDGRGKETYLFYENPRWFVERK